MLTVLPAVLLFCAGLWLTMRGGDCFVDAAAAIASASGVPRFVVGATIVSLATTLPELLVSLLAAGQGSGDLAVGNAVGSVICNTGLILGLSALCRPAAPGRRAVFAKGWLLIAAAILTAILSSDGLLSAPEGLVLAALLALFLFLNLQSARAGRPDAGQHIRLAPRQKLRYGGGFVLGAAAVLTGARLMVDNGVLLARMAGLSEAVIGLTLVAVGTSLPELMTALAALRRKEAALSAGNILGANIIDLTLVLPACALRTGGLPVSADTVLRDLPAALGLVMLALFPVMARGRFSRVQGAFLLAAYAAFLSTLLA